MALFRPHSIDWLSTVYGGQFPRSKVHWRSKSVLGGTSCPLQQSYNLSGVTNVFLGENSLTVRCIGKRNVLSSFATHFSDTIFSVLSHFTPSVSIVYTLHYYTQKLHLKQKRHGHTIFILTLFLVFIFALKHLTFVVTSCFLGGHVVCPYYLMCIYWFLMTPYIFVAVTVVEKHA